MTGQGLQQRFNDNMGQLLGPVFPSDIALAVSGGGDSMAMLYFAHSWTRVFGLRLWVVTVDHGLRPESAAEAAMVAAECNALGWPHATLRWHWDGQGNLMDAARRARLSLIDRWRGGLEHVLMAHTADDVAETFLQRLKRGSGVEGLSAMAPRRRVCLHPNDKPGLPDADVTATHRPPIVSRGDAGLAGCSPDFEILRPCLDMRRDDLRHVLKTLQGRWVDDPSNDDQSYDRVRMRRLLADLNGHGLGTETLAPTAQRMARAQVALRARAAQVWGDIGQEDRDAGHILFDRTGFAAVEEDTQLRLLAAALQYVSTAKYRPRLASLEDLLDRLLSGGAGTLHGCETRCERNQIRVYREFARVADRTVRIGVSPVWDNRWRISGCDFKGLTLRALGEDGWAQIGEKPETAPPFHAARSLPSVWDGDQVVFCPPVGIGDRGRFRLGASNNIAPDFGTFLLSH